MVDALNDLTSKESKRMVFLTNRQASLFDQSSIHKLLDAFEIPPPKLVIRLLPCRGGPQTRAFGMVSAFRHVAKDNTYTEEWKKVLRIQAENNPNVGIVQDCLPDPPFLSSANADKAQWQLECFMREVVVPAAARNNALVIGSAFRDDELMTTFARVAIQLQDKLSGAGTKPPWNMFGVADAPSLSYSVEQNGTVAKQFYNVSSMWRRRFEKIREAKRLADRERQKLGDDDKDKPIDAEYEIAYDLNPFLHNVVVVDCVNEDKQGHIFGIDSGPLDTIRMMLMEHLVSKYPCIGIGSMHLEGGYQGLDFAAGMLHLNVPFLLLDMRIQEERPFPDGAESYCFPASEAASKELYENVCRQIVVNCCHCGAGLTGSNLATSCTCEGIFNLSSGQAICGQIDSNEKMKPLAYMEKSAQALFDVAKQSDETYSARLMQIGRADIFETCRLAYFHSFLIQDREKTSSSARSKMRLYERIASEEETLQSATQDTSSKFRGLLLDKITDWCTQAEFRAYWELKSEAEKQEILTDTGISDFREYFKREISAARTAYHTVMSDKILYTAHVKDTARLDYIVNHKMMDIEGLPEKNTLEGLLVLRQAWDLIDIGHYNIKRHKIVAKVCYVLLILLAVAITAISIEKDALDADGKLYQGRKLSELITFGLSVATSFVTAIMAFTNPVTRWHQLRDVVAKMESALWHFRTRTGEFTIHDDSDTRAILALKDQVLKCRDQIASAADVQETSFYQIYPASVFRHDQRSGKVVQAAASKPAGKRISPANAAMQAEKGMTEKVIIDLEDPESLNHAYPDDHHSPVNPDNYIRLRLYPVMSFYRDRLPRYTRAREVYSLLLLLGSSLGAVLAFVGYASQVAIITAVTSGITAWTEFVSTARKISRYNASIVAIENHCLWWDSLSLVEKASPINVQALTHIGESIINAERSSWMSAPKQGPDKKSKDDGDKESKGKKLE